MSCLSTNRPGRSGACPAPCMQHVASLAATTHAYLEIVEVIAHDAGGLDCAVVGADEAVVGQPLGGGGAGWHWRRHEAGTDRGTAVGAPGAGDSSVVKPETGNHLWAGKPRR